MKRLLLLILLVVSKAYSSPEAINYNAITNFEGEPSNYVHNVDITTGNYCESVVDLVVPGAEPLVVQRFYSSDNTSNSYIYSNGICGAVFFTNYGSTLATFPSDDERVKKVYLKELNGNVCHFQGKVDYQLNCYKMHIDPVSYKHGHTNCGKGLISGRTNIKNIRAFYDTPTDELEMRTHAQVIYGSGKKREFVDNRETRDHLPNGNSIIFEYDDKKNLRKVKSLNSLGKKIASLNYPAPDFNYKKSVEWEITTNDNRFVRYKLKRSDNGYWLEEVTTSDGPKVKYKWEDWRNGAVIKKVEYPEDRFLEIEYTHPHSSIVKKLYEPVGYDERPIVIYRFEYEEDEINDKKTVDVKDAEQNLTRYECKLGRIESITRFQGGKEILNSEKCYWGAVDTPDYTNLITRAIVDAHGKVHLCRHMKYDASGNIVKEVLYGNLTGTNVSNDVTVDEKGKPKSNGCDYYVKEYSHSKDGLNLVMSEKDNRSKITYSYYPKRDLMKSKFIWDKEQIVIRNFYEYDANGVLICEINDNGTSEDKDNLTGVTERHIKRVKVRTEQAPIGAPAEIETKYLDLSTGYERLLHRTINDYTPQGRIKAQHHYDSANGYLYSLYWEYDAMGRVIRETDALGHIKEKKYDANGNLIYEQGPQQDIHFEYKYDYSNRLIAKDKVLNDGTRLSEHFKYNYLNQKTAITDVYGNETTFAYDALGHLITTTFAPTIDENGQLVQTVLKSSYDVLGYPLATIDGKGNVTESLHTARGKPYFIRYSDSSTEKNEYSLDGLLLKNISRTGLTTQYEYDFQGRVLKEEALAATGELLSKRTFRYNAFHLLSETDQNGNIISYHYDGAGRLIRTTKGKQITDLVYDSCGRIASSTVYEYSKPETAILLRYQYDVLNRVIAEETEDLQGSTQNRVEYGYDVMGNRTQVITYSDAGKAVNQTTYDPLGQVIQISDPEGQVTVIRYDYQYINDRGQHVAFKEVIDPMGNVCQDIHDPLGRIAQVIRKNKFGKVTQKHTITYDKNSNQKCVEHTVIAPNASERKVVTSWNYNSTNQVTSITDALGTQEQKQTNFKYNAYGQKEQIIKPDGTKIKHLYDGIGRLKDLSSSDKSIHYVYSYDLKGNCVKVEDLVNQSVTLRSYDGLDRILQETLDNGLTVKYDVDAHGRPVQMILPDQTSVRYHYEGARLKEISRHDQSGSEQYHHVYSVCDLSGHVLQCELPGAAGKLTQSFDLCGRIKAINHKRWSETIPDNGYDKTGNLLKAATIDNVGELNHQFSYDDLYQVKTEKGAFNHKYSYDSLYNRLEKDTNKTKLNHLNQLLSDSDKNYSYDLNGNLIQIENEEGIVRLSYDALDRLIGVKSDKMQVAYGYDAFNRRVSKTVNKVISRYIFSGENECGRANNKGLITEFRVLGLGKGAEIGAAVAVELKNSVYVPVHNHAGSVMTLLKADDGSVFETYRYGAFGEETIYDALGEKQSVSLNPWRFVSKRVDSETGFVFFGRRCYDPCSGRWITRDPKGYEAGPNLYAFVANNPLVRFDVYGLDWVQEGDTWVVRRDEHDRSSSQHYRSRREVSVSERYRENKPDREDFFRGVTQKVGENLQLGNRFLFSNGIDTDAETIKRRAEKMSAALAGIEVSAYHIQDHGVLIDLLHNSLVRLGGCTPAVHSLVNEIRGFIAEAYEVGLLDPNIYIKVHSNGGRILSKALEHLTKEERGMMTVFTFGSAAIIPKGYVKEARNYIAQGDVIPWLGDTGGMIKASMNSNYADIRYVPSKGGPLARHNFEGSYADANLQVDQFINNQMKGR